jgi:glycine/D-amino acid oxidase-like deaminating enzyme
MVARSADIVVVGGGLTGPAIAYGAARRGLSVIVLDEGDAAFRAARANFGLVWFQGKGLGMPSYVAWTLAATQQWPGFAADLEEDTGIGVDYRKAGGLHLCLGDNAMANRRRHIGQIATQVKPDVYDVSFLDRRDVQAALPDAALGKDVVGASFSAHDGHANPLRLMRAFHTGILRHGGAYLPGHKVIDIKHAGGAWTARTAIGDFQAPRLVLAAGLGLADLAPKAGLDVPVVAERGQVMVTERTRPILPFPMSGIRQTVDGTIMLGATNERVGHNDTTTTDGMGALARNAVKAIPDLARLKLVRAWAGLRVLTPDKYPIYVSSENPPGAYAVISHSGVTLASVNATTMVSWIVDGERPALFDTFLPERFHVQAA